MDIPVLLSTLSAALKFAGELNEVGKTFDEATWKLKVAEMSSLLASAKIGAIELKEEIDAREKQISDLKTAFAFRGQTVERHGMRYEAKDGRPIGLRFCPRCEVVDGCFIREGRPEKCPQFKADYGRPTAYLYLVKIRRRLPDRRGGGWGCAIGEPRVAVRVLTAIQGPGGRTKQDHSP